MFLLFLSQFLVFFVLVLLTLSETIYWFFNVQSFNMQHLLRCDLIYRYYLFIWDLEHKIETVWRNTHDFTSFLRNCGVINSMLKDSFDVIEVILTFSNVHCNEIVMNFFDRNSIHTLTLCNIFNWGVEILSILLNSIQIYFSFMEIRNRHYSLRHQVFWVQDNIGKSVARKKI